MDAAGLNVKIRSIVDRGKSTFSNTWVQKQDKNWLMVGQSGVGEGTGMICPVIVGIVKAELR